MVDWMLEVLHVLNQSDFVFLRSVSLLDQYFKRTKKVIDVTDLHLNGMVCMFIASKYEEIEPIKIRELIDEVGHFIFSKEDIQNKELDILKTLQFQVGNPIEKELVDMTLMKLTGQILITQQFLSIV